LTVDRHRGTLLVIPGEVRDLISFHGWKGGTT
jgi:hypothetical protein